MDGTAGQALWVPRQWWHWVQCLEPSVSVNQWVPVPEDDGVRVGEAVVRYTVARLRGPPGAYDEDNDALTLAPDEAGPGLPWLNAAATVDDEDGCDVADARATLAAWAGLDERHTTAALARALTHPAVVELVVRLLADERERHTEDHKRRRIEGDPADGPG
jgi:hypothetical protein